VSFNSKTDVPAARRVNARGVFVRYIELRWLAAVLGFSYSFAANAQLGGFADGIAVGQVTERTLAEISGLVSSRNNPGVIWIHNDRARDEIYAVGTDGQLFATYNLGKEVADMEDIAIGPGPVPELQYLYCGDIGDNPATRSNIRVYRAAEPAVYEYLAVNPLAEDFPIVERFTFTYPDGKYDAETLMVDPWTGDVYIATKQFNFTRIYRASRAQLFDGATVTLVFELELNFHQVSSGDISADGREIILRQENFARVWRRNPGQTIAQALMSEPADVPVIGMPMEPNGEGVTFDGQGLGYYTISEGANPFIYFFARTNDPPSALAQVLISTGSSWNYLDKGSDQGTAWRGSGFSDAAWPLGRAQLGYGDDDQQTTISFGSDRDAKHPTVYFRKQLKVENAAAFGPLTMGLVYDDAIAVYLNGTEVLRRNLAPNARFNDVALSSGGALENLWQTFAVTNLLRTGTNTVAVEVHRRSLSEGDLSFDLQLSAYPAPTPIQFIGQPRRIAAATIALDFRGPVGATVFIDRSFNLNQWSALASIVLTNGAASLTNNIGSGTPSCFFRLRE